ncbi:N-acetyl-gamma-glutamyl-phosphate reductase [Actinidia chinensis var. chinensis]|uniref:N-acetyl-gamma-glutamyl-phosphate reductase n=1 Tax=Actinidia chinensis var. chinensis TaxID=1590841 RepID=A0A2R6P778_ACTCC|nr:N-acetyl-gamma-glutamyl-phosphate reductase [Actinidia chinensis var. chinensis]
MDLKELASISISISSRENFAMHFHIAGGCKFVAFLVKMWWLSEIKDCLEEAGFRSVHFWIRQMPDAEDIKSIKGFGSGREVKYEEVSSFEQQDSWNACVVGVAY